MNRFQTVALTALLGGATLLADFSYDQTTRITGGAMLNMMKFAGAFSAKAREPMTSTILVKGDRMTRLSRDHAEIIDLGRETITHIDFQKKTWSVMTFAQMKQQMEEMSQRMRKHGGNDDSTQMSFKASVKDTGRTKPINGVNTHERILTLTMEGTDQKSGQTGSMDISNDMWLAPDVPGYGEIRDFHRRMAEKLGFVPGQSFGPMMARPDMQKGMADLVKEMSKLDGVPLVTVTTMSGAGQPGMDQPTSGGSQQSSASADDSPAAKLGRLAGIGGFGRKKKNADQQQQQEQGPPANTQPGVLAEITTESSAFSSAPVDPSKFEVPAGFKQVQPDRRRGE
jgi:hypothetical protein